MALVLLAFGLALAGGGAVLAASGGSPWYLLTGVACILSGVLLWRGDVRGVWIYGAMLVWTVAWSIWEVLFRLAACAAAHCPLRSLRLVAPPVDQAASGRQVGPMADSRLGYLHRGIGRSAGARRPRPYLSSPFLKFAHVFFRQPV
ncbi:hypothetical protein GCM10023165_26670 [Variovorax defluvii]|uniref:Quinoprotein glucose dehydrogenase n=1 Tax=Variovorax defluvii TaxID=913761 RepID=A0ABP8HSX2_9BURK